MIFSARTSLKEVVDWLSDHITEGAECPACGQRVQRYRRSITSGMAWVLCQMYRQGGWVHVPSLGTRGGDPIKTRHWGLIERREGQRDDGSQRNGWWRLTPRGERFVEGQERVPRYAYFYNGECVGFEEDTVSIIDALGTVFNYDELMRGSRS